MSLETPVLMCIFNRPGLTRRVFERIAQQRPGRLLVLADGPRAHVAEDLGNVAAARAVIGGVDWDCDLELNFSDVNLGCRRRMATGLDWAFDLCERLIVLEDDCLPHPSFFSFCQQLLQRFADDPRVMMISGDNFQPRRVTPYSYYFSRWAHIWGWASWRRAWRHYDLQMQSWPEAKRDQLLRAVLPEPAAYEYWSGQFDRQAAGEVDTWDFAWQYACWMQNGLTVLPAVNLVSNLGFGPEATHTIDPQSPVADLPLQAMGPLVHPPWVLPHRAADWETWTRVFLPLMPDHRPPAKPSLWQRLAPGGRRPGPRAA